jgi:hypothetical protein
MSDISPWMQDNWLELGSLLIQLAFLAAGVWFARNILRTMRAFQDQIVALLKLAVTSRDTEQRPLSASAKPTQTAGSAILFPTDEEQALSHPEPIELIESGPSWIVRAWHGVAQWLQTPMSNRGTGPFVRILEWFRAPIGS